MGGRARHLIGAAQIEATMQKVISMDLQNHLEWIAKS